MNDANQVWNGQLIKAESMSLVAIDSYRFTTKNMEGLNREAIRALANDCRKRNVIILLMMRIKFTEMLIPSDVLMTLHWTTFATAMGNLSDWEGIKTMGHPDQAALSSALDGFAALAVKGSLDEIKLDYGEEISGEGHILSNEMRQTLEEIKSKDIFEEDKGGFYPKGGFEPRSPWDRN